MRSVRNTKSRFLYRFENGERKIGNSRCYLLLNKGVCFIKHYCLRSSLPGFHHLPLHIQFWERRTHTYPLFLALLDFVSRATAIAQASVIHPSVVRKLRFLRNRCMDPGQILWVAPSPPYLQTIFSSASILAEIMVQCELVPACVWPSSRLSLSLLRLFGSDFTCGLL